MRFLFSILFIFLLFGFSSASAQFNYRRTYGYSNINEGKAVKRGVDGGYVITGITGINNTDIYILKINDDGTLNWQHTIGSSGIDHANSMVTTYDSCYVLAGYSNSFSGSGDYDFFVVKVDRNGQVIWHTEVGGPDWDFGYSIIQSSDNGYIIVGNTYNGNSGSSDGIFTKIDSLGNFVWERIMNTPGDDYLYGVALASDGNYIANGTMINGNGGSKDIIIEKVNDIGDSLWFKEYGSTDDEESFAIFSGNGTSMIVGSNKDTQKLNNLSFRISDNGDSLSTILLSHSEDEITTSLDTSNSMFMITGYTSSFGAGNKELFISRIDLLGNDLQGSTYGGAEDDVGNSICSTPDGGAIAIGYTKSYGPGIQAVFVVKVDTNLIANANVVIGISEENDHVKMFSLFSDPCTHLLTISFDPSYQMLDKVKINIFDLNGKMISYTSFLTEHKLQIKMENSSAGFYLVQITDAEGKSVTMKFLMQ